MEDKHLVFVPEEMNPRDAYRLLVSVVVPRPIAWVSSMGRDGSLNLAPFSFFNVVGDNPPTIMVSIGSKRGGASKDTLRNVLETREFVVNIVDEALAERMNLTSGDWPQEQNEFEVAGLARAEPAVVRSPRVADAAIALEARLSQVVPVEGTAYTMVLGHVVCLHIRPSLLSEAGLVDVSLLRPVARLGGDDYTVVERTFAMPRPVVKPTDRP